MTFSIAEQALIEIDPQLGHLITTHGTIARQSKSDYFSSLASSIISQQISVKAAAKILERFESQTRMQPEAVLGLSDADKKTIGLSGQKSRYLHDLSEHFYRDSAVFNHLDTLADDKVITELTKVKGIGVWTAQMFLMFTLIRPDVFAPDDRGLQLAIKQLYSLDTVPDRNELETIAQKWAPYRTTASWHLWRSLDNEPVSA